MVRILLPDYARLTWRVLYVPICIRSMAQSAYDTWSDLYTMIVSSR